MLIACFCGHTDVAGLDGNEICCRRCGRRLFPSDFAVPARLAREIREILDRIGDVEDGEQTG